MLLVQLLFDIIHLKGFQHDSFIHLANHFFIPTCGEGGTTRRQVNMEHVLSNGNF